MGVCFSGLHEKDKATKDSQIIDSMIHSDQLKVRDVIKLLLLGGGESGKSTIFKQMKILYGDGFSVDDRIEFKKFIFSNMLESMRTLCIACERLGFADQIKNCPEFEEISSLLDKLCFGASTRLTPELAQCLKFLWTHEAIQRTWQERSLIQVPDAAQFYFGDIDRITAIDYIPSIEDVLRTRVRTSGIIEERYFIDSNEFLMIDVGGQKNERKKWIHCFSNVDAIIFVAALSEYDQTLYEEQMKNRMIDAIDLFDTTCNNEYFVRTPLMLFLNKSDLFKEKIKYKSISSVPEFDDYDGRSNHYDDGVKYFVRKFGAVNQNKQKDIFFHVTCAMDTTNIEFVLNACKEIILKQTLLDFDCSARS